MLAWTVQAGPSAMGGRNPEGLCPLSDLTRHKAERTVRRLIEEAHRLACQFCFLRIKKTIQFNSHSLKYSLQLSLVSHPVALRVPSLRVPRLEAGGRW